MAATIFTDQTPATTELDFITHFFGMEFSLSAVGVLTGGRAWVPSGGRPDTFFWQLWRVLDQALLAEVNLRDPVFGTPANGAWLSFTSANFLEPGDIDLAAAGTTSYVEGLFSDDGQFTYTAGGSFPVGTGIVSSNQGRFRTGGAQTDFPNGTHTAYGFGDVSIELPSVSRPGVIVSPTAAHRAGSW